MSIGFFIVGGIIFSAYIGLTVWGISHANRKQRESNNYSEYVAFKKKLEGNVSKEVSIKDKVNS